MGTRQDEFEARMDARTADMEQTNSDNFLGIQSNLGERFEERDGMTATQVRDGVDGQLEYMEFNTVHLPKKTVRRLAGQHQLYLKDVTQHPHTIIRFLCYEI
ncbi:MAG: hypothetical protein Q9174_002521 [Haloplaca sp. 1 TL-2023]